MHPIKVRGTFFIAYFIISIVRCCYPAAHCSAALNPQRSRLAQGHGDLVRDLHQPGRQRVQRLVDQAQEELLRLLVCTHIALEHKKSTT